MNAKLLSFGISCALGGSLLLQACGTDSPDLSGSDPQDFRGSALSGSSLPDKTLVLTFDDGPAGRTAELGTYLANERIPATFFVLGKAAANQMATLSQLASQGHLIANHTWNHPALTATQDPVGEVKRTDQLLQPYMPRGVHLFRAPYGDWSSRVASILNSNGLRKYVGHIGWDIGGELSRGYAADWDCWNRGWSVNRCGEAYLREIRAKRRGIVLLHDVHSKTVSMVKQIIPTLKAEGYRFVQATKIPLIANEIRSAGGNTDSDDTPQEIGEIVCPAGYSLLKVGQLGGQVCENGTDVLGPFTKAMVEKCKIWGGGGGCESDKWSKRLALSARGTGLCPLGATYDSQTTYCVEGADAFGPFPPDLVDACLRSGGGEDTCKSARWSQRLLAGLLRNRS